MTVRMNHTEAADALQDAIGELQGLYDTGTAQILIEKVVMALNSWDGIVPASVLRDIDWYVHDRACGDD